MKSTTSEKARHLVLRADPGELLPDAIIGALRDEVVVCGWLRASGVLAEMEIRAYQGDALTPAPVRRIAGPAQVIVLDGSIGLAKGDVSVGMRVVVARETDHGMETITGELVAARVVALEAIVTALDDVALARAIDPSAGVWMLGEAPPGSTIEAANAAPGPAWSDAIAASAEAPPPVAPPPARRAQASAPSLNASSSGGSVTSGVPPVAIHRYARAFVDDDVPFPEAGDAVEHFAFGACDVIKSDGDRLHLKVHKNSSIKEIALEMLKVTALPAGENGQKRFRLDRRL